MASPLTPCRLGSLHLRCGAQRLRGDARTRALCDVPLKASQPGQLFLVVTLV